MTKRSVERYAFGANWRNFLAKNYSEERLAVAQDWLLGFLDLPDLKGRSFLDIGCGSGLHSLAALRAGAERILSFDYDPDSVAATRSLWELAGNPAHWEVRQGSVLDEAFMAGLGSFDVVYSWGVLHHTGEQWRALKLAAPCVAATGRFYLALYAREQYLDPDAILALKRRYNSAGWLRRALMEFEQVWSTVCHRKLNRLLRLPMLAREYQRSRGMAVLTDARDWLGGWPMEFSSVREINDFLDARSLAMVKVKTGLTNTEYLFMPKAQAAAEGRPALQPDDIAVVRLPVLRSMADLPAGRDYYIFGTAWGGELLLAAAGREGRRPTGFIDLIRTGEMAGLPILHPDDFAQKLPADTLVVLGSSYVQENAERLWRHGFSNIFNAHPLVMALVRGD